MTMLRSLAFACLLSIQTASAQQQCPLCFGGATANLNNTIGGAPNGVKCSDVVTDVELDLDGCRELQLLGYRYCDCPEYPEEHFCPMCKDSFAAIPNKFKLIPDGTGKTCDDRLFVQANKVNSCEDAMKPGYVCGCPDAAEPFCQICGGSIKDDEQITNKDEVLTINGVGSYSCQELVNQALLGSLTVDQCSLVQAEAFTACGCPGADEVSMESTTDEEISTPNNATTVPVQSDSSPNPTEDSSAAHSTTFTAALLSVLASQVVLFR